MEVRAKEAGGSGLTAAAGARRRRFRALGVCLIAGSVVVVAGGVLGAVNPGGFVWVGRLLHNTFVFGVVAALGFTVGCALLIRSRRLRTAVIVLGVVVAVVWALAGAYVWSLFRQPELMSVSAPAGSGSSYELVVRESSDGLLDPAWVLSIRQTGSPFAREWYLGCMSGDDPQAGFKSAEWRDRGNLLVTVEAGNTHTVTVDPSTGKPLGSDQHLWTC